MPSRAKTASPKKRTGAEQQKPRNASRQPPAWAAAILLGVAIAVIYGPAIDAPFFFDDAIAIVRNKSITTLWPPIGTADRPGPLNPPLDNPVSARPLVNASFAINYALGGYQPRGYHLVSFVTHFCAALALYAVIRRTLRLPYFAERFEASAGWLALAASLLWAVHPLQTEAVMYASQRTELMMALFYLVTLYCSLRYWSEIPLPFREGQGEGSSSDRNRTLWLTLAILACAAGMASKEVMVSAPLIVLLFDRAFIAGSLTRAIRRSWPLYLGLAATWLLLLYLNLGSPRGASAGFNLGVDAYRYWLTQAKVVLLYFRLVLWPWPLLVYYELPYFGTFREAAIWVVPLAILVFALLVMLWRNHPLGFLGASVFAVLAPTSVVPIVTEMAAERRMYLPLAPIFAFLVVAAYMAARLVLTNREALSLNRLGRPTLALTAIASCLLLVCGVASAQRVREYRDPMLLWDEVLRFQPNNSVAHQNKAYLLDQARNLPAALDEYRDAVRLTPDSVEAQLNLSTLLLKAGASSEAVEHLKAAVSLAPNDSSLRNNLATALYICKRFEEAIIAYRETLQLDPDNWQIHKNLGITLEKAGKYEQAIQSFENTLRLNPAAISTYLDMTKTYALAGQPEKAAAMLKRGFELATSAGDTATAQKFAAALRSTKQSSPPAKNAAE